VIEALRKHDIAFHSNFHSVHPTPTEYLRVRVTRRRGGVRSAEAGRRTCDASFSRVFIVLRAAGVFLGAQAAIGLPGSGVTAAGGVPCYVDSGSQWDEGKAVHGMRTCCTCSTWDQTRHDLSCTCHRRWTRGRRRCRRSPSGCGRRAAG